MNWKEKLKTRYVLLSIVLAALCAILAALTVFLHCLPEKRFKITLQPTMLHHVDSQSTEFRVYYVKVDDVFINLKPYLQDAWYFEGDLITWMNTPLTFEVNASRDIDISLRKGSYAGQGIITVNGEKTYVDLYSTKDGEENIISISAHSFLNLYTLSAAIIIFLLVIMGMMLIGKKYNYFNNYWLSSVSIKDMVISAGIVGSVLMLMSTSSLAPYMRRWSEATDVSVFIADAKLINMGRTIYSQVWDHKGPALLFFNAWGARYWFPHGAWLFETILQVAGFSFLYFGLKQIFSKYLSFAATIVTIVTTINFIRVGDYSESWALPFILLGFYIFMRACKYNFNISMKWVFVFGSACAIVLLTRYNNVVFWVIALPIIAISQLYDKRYAILIRQIISFVSGFCLIISVMSIYLLSKNIFIDFWNATVSSNLGYVSTVNSSIFSPIDAIKKIMETTRFSYGISSAVTTFNILVLVGILFGGFNIYYKTRNERSDKLVFLLYAIGLPVSFYLAAVSGRTYAHYLLITIPFMALMYTYCIKFVVEIVQNCFAKNKTLQSCSIILLLFIFLTPHYNLILSDYRYYSKAPYTKEQLTMLTIAKYIEANTSPEDTYGSWGSNEIVINFMDGRWPASRFGYCNLTNVMPLDSEIGRYNLSLYMSELKESEPKYFVATKRYKRPMELDRYLREHYIPLEIFGDVADYCEVYQKK